MCVEIVLSVTGMTKDRKPWGSFVPGKKGVFGGELAIDNGGSRLLTGIEPLFSKTPAGAEGTKESPIDIKAPMSRNC